jgi:hypothetical protein
MVAFSVRLFDPIEYSKQLRSAGFSQEQAEVQAQTMERVMETVVNLTREEVRTQDLVAKKDLIEFESALKKDLLILQSRLEKDIATLRNDLFKWVLTVGVSSCIVLISAMATLFKLFLH